MLNSSAYDGTVEFNIAESKKGSGFPGWKPLPYFWCKKCWFFSKLNLFIVFLAADRVCQQSEATNGRRYNVHFPTCHSEQSKESHFRLQFRRSFDSLRMTQLRFAYVILEPKVKFKEFNFVKNLIRLPLTRELSTCRVDWGRDKKGGHCPPQ